jgi:hypothetical protein
MHGAGADRPGGAGGGQPVFRLLNNTANLMHIKYTQAIAQDNIGKW